MNALISPFSLLLLGAASLTAQVAVIPTFEVHRYRLLPIWVVALLVVAALLWIGNRLRAVRGWEQVQAVEADGVWYLVVPALLAVVTCALPAPLFSVDLFHYGELTVGPFLLSRGALPWRDVVFIHGLLSDVLIPLAGFHVFGESIWAGLAGLTVFGSPAWWIAYYFLFLYLFRDRPVLLIAALAIPFCWTVNFIHWRFLPYPLILLALAALVRRDTWPRAWVLGALLVGSNVLVPELAYAVPATAVILLGCDFGDRSRGERLARRFGRTLKVATAGAILTVGFGVLLQSLGLLSAFSTTTGPLRRATSSPVDSLSNPGITGTPSSS